MDPRSCYRGRVNLLADLECDWRLKANMGLPFSAIEQSSACPEGDLTTDIEQGKGTLLDSDRVCPWIIRPNERELDAPVGRPGTCREA